MKSAAALLTAMIVVAPSWAADEPGTLPPDLDAVPADAIAFAHVRIADIWKSEALKDVRETVMKAGEKSLAGFDRRFLPAPSSIERLTAVLIPQDAELKRPPAFYAILSVNKPFDRQEFLKSALPAAVEQKAAGGGYWTDAKSEIAVCFSGERMIVFGNAAGVQRFLKKRASGPKPLTDALHAANTARHVTIGVNIGMIPAKSADDAPPPVRPLLAAKTAMLNFDLAKNSRIDLNLTFADEQAADAGMKAVIELAKLGREFIKKNRQDLLAKVAGEGKPAPLDKLPETTMMLAGLGGLQRIDNFLANLPIQHDRQTIKLSATMPSLSYALLAPAAAGMVFYFIVRAERPSTGPAVDIRAPDKRK